MLGYFVSLVYRFETLSFYILVQIVSNVVILVHWVNFIHYQTHYIVHNLNNFITFF
ncbi:hypothetical protein HanIR_Chr10g0459461 [Helianthus annuus]|nr:hypothetical protein HanIR_Chr10g0459461 [Helianthus annuus]